MSRARKRAILESVSPVNETASEIGDAIRTLARAVCCLAVKQEARNPGEQRELAAILWADVLGDFREVPTTEEMRCWMAALLKIPPESLSKRPYGK